MNNHEFALNSALRASAVHQLCSKERLQLDIMWRSLSCCRGETHLNFLNNSTCSECIEELRNLTYGLSIIHPEQSTWWNEPIEMAHSLPNGGYNLSHRQAQITVLGRSFRHVTTEKGNKRDRMEKMMIMTMEEFPLPLMSVLSPLGEEERSLPVSCYHWWTLKESQGRKLVGCLSCIGLRGSRLYLRPSAHTPCSCKAL